MIIGGVVIRDVSAVYFIQVRLRVISRRCLELPIAFPVDGRAETLFS